MANCRSATQGARTPSVRSHSAARHGCSQMPQRGPGHCELPLVDRDRPRVNGREPSACISMRAAPNRGRRHRREAASSTALRYRPGAHSPKEPRSAPVISGSVPWRLIDPRLRNLPRRRIATSRSDHCASLHPNFFVGSREASSRSFGTGVLNILWGKIPLRPDESFVFHAFSLRPKDSSSVL